MSGYGALVAVTLLLLAGASSAPTPRIYNSIVSGVTTGLELPNNVMAGTGVGTGSLQLVINVHTDSNGNIEVFNN